MKSRPVDPRVERIVDLFERFSRADLDTLDQFYRADASFKDPFNEVRGIDPIKAVYRHMFDSLDDPRFIVKDAVVQRDHCFLTWDFHFRMRRYRRDPQTVRGASHLHLDDQGRICMHRDYWDAAEEVYEKLPLLGGLMRWLKRRASA